MVTRQEGEAIAKERAEKGKKTLFLETSAKTGANVDSCFRAICKCWQHAVLVGFITSHLPLPLSVSLFVSLPLLQVNPCQSEQNNEGIRCL